MQLNDVILQVFVYAIGLSDAWSTIDCRTVAVNFYVENYVAFHDIDTGVEDSAAY